MNFKVYSDGKKMTDPSLPIILEQEVGLFESLRTYGDHLFRLDEHLDRLLASAKTSGYPYPVQREKIRKEALNAVRMFRGDVGADLRVRPWNGTSHGPTPSGPTARQGRRHGSAPTDLFIRITLYQGRTFVMIGEKKHPASLYKKGVVLKTSPVRRTHPNAVPAQVKTNDYHNAVLASLEPSPPGTYEWLFLDASGYVTEVRIGNIFIVKGSDPRSIGVRPQLFTPPTVGVLDGVTRRVVIECALQSGLVCRETPLTRHEIYNAEEAFLTNTSWEILPVARLDGRSIGTRVPGPVTRILQQEFRKLIEIECRGRLMPPALTGRRPGGCRPVVRAIPRADTRVRPYRIK